MPKIIAQALGALLLISAVTPASAWDRGYTDIFAILPEWPGGPVPSEGLTVGPDGTVYTPSFGINSKGPVAGPPHLFSFTPTASCFTTLRWSIRALHSPAPCFSAWCFSNLHRHC